MAAITKAIEFVVKNPKVIGIVFIVQLVILGLTLGLIEMIAEALAGVVFFDAIASTGVEALFVSLVIKYPGAVLLSGIFLVVVNAVNVMLAVYVARSVKDKKNAMAAVMKRMKEFLGVGVFLTVFIMLLFAAGLVILWIASLQALMGVLLFLGYLAAVLYLGIKFMYATAIMGVENQTFVKGLKQSYKWTHKHFKQAVFTAVVLLVFVFIIQGLTHFVDVSIAGDQEVLAVLISTLGNSIATTGTYAMLAFSYLSAKA